MKGAIQQMNAALDGKGDVTEDINAAAQALAAGTQQLQDAVDAIDMEAIQKQIKELTGTGKNLITEAGEMSGTLDGISGSMSKFACTGTNITAEIWQVFRHRYKD